VVVGWHVGSQGVPGGFVEGVHSEAGPDVGGDGVGLGLGEAGGEFDVAVGEEVVDVGLGEDWGGGVFFLGRHGGGLLVVGCCVDGCGRRRSLQVPAVDWIGMLSCAAAYCYIHVCVTWWTARRVIQVMFPILPDKAKRYLLLSPLRVATLLRSPPESEVSRQNDGWPRLKRRGWPVKCEVSLLTIRQSKTSGYLEV
jgi:hypothetical protein